MYFRPLGCEIVTLVSRMKLAKETSFCDIPTHLPVSNFLPELNGFVQKLPTYIYSAAFTFFPSLFRVAAAELIFSSRSARSVRLRA